MYDKTPFVAVGAESECLCGWDRIVKQLRSRTEGVVCIECYPGVLLDEIEVALLPAFTGWRIIHTADLFLSPEILAERFDPLLTDDPVFGVMNQAELADFFDLEKILKLRLQPGAERTLVIGTGATIVCPKPALLVYADLARWEIQLRQRRNLIANLGLDNETERASLQYKRAFFLDWRAADRMKQRLLPQIDYLLDTNVPDEPRLISGDAFRRGLREAVTRPFRVAPFFDPGPWGGHWMERVCDLPDDGAPNHAWCFDCVPEENSLLLGFGSCRVEIPSLDLVLAHPRELLGDAIYNRFGAEFPIRFDFLDTVGGGNLSLQVHPLTDYIRRQFGMTYTQDESYYLLDAEPGATVYLGLKEGIKPAEMIADLESAQAGEIDFPAETYVNQFPAQKHDHFLIPAGTVHCSGAGSMVLEISATPYIFTFKLWDWGRLGLDGRPRPIHLAHGIRNIQWDRTTEWVKASLINRFETVASGDGWREERTGLHPLEFIETRRHWFSTMVHHDTRGTVHVLNLVEGDEAIVESPSGAFAPFVVHYAETFIVPAAVGAYTIRPHGPSAGRECATMLAYVR
ncbi:MAG TPA: class I mannose-6-phosphate isomerase [Acidobacteriaceae bacterium]|jgi:mannose-6-phosphate isomerase class I|nr:class I mannose-6-phosphate isomerase [Acidobacteriaceae bacterium]